MTPPPVCDARNFSGRPSIPTSQSITCVSSSVHAGLVDHSIPCTPRPEESRSPRIPGPDALHGKYAKKLGADLIAFLDQDLGELADRVGADVDVILGLDLAQE